MDHQFPGALGEPATANLRTYISQATLPALKLAACAPPVPPPGHKSHANVLSPRLNKDRRLHTMFQLDMKEDEILAFLDGIVPKEPVDEDDEDPHTGERLSVPCNPGFSIPYPTLPAARTLDRIVSWFDYLPFETVQRVLHLIYPPSRSWSLLLHDGDEDKDLLRYFTWTENMPKHENYFGRPKVAAVVIVQPPWILSELDLDHFASCMSFPSQNAYGTATLHGKERLWAKVFDLCRANNCRYFIVSNYSGWVIGAFTKAWSRAFQSRIYFFDETKPSVLECLTYWLTSSIGIAGGFAIPTAPEPYISVQPPQVVQDLDDMTEHASESTWAGKSDEAPSSAGVYGGAVSTDGLPPPWAPIYRKPSIAQMQQKDFFIHDWNNSVPSNEPFAVQSNAGGSMTLSHWSSDTTVQKASTVHAYGGSWLTP
ncbi:hypothetical protein DENSPDRAFT_837132 [Dentipellis sp. KUC8613]|nr:hypothetical protein DENSPDRAFT_837132 [Dentipellis sp. KUC8613]